MLRILEVAFTGYPVTDLKRARNFYENILGLKPAMHHGPDDAAWVEYEIGPSTLAISNMAAAWKPSSDGPTIALEMEDFDAAIAWLKEKQVTFAVEPFASPVCRMAIIADPDGNTVTIHKRNAEHAH